jgi:hypothetical protein
MSDMGCTGMSEDNAAIAERHLDSFGAHFGGLRMDSRLICFEGRKAGAFLIWYEVSKRPKPKVVREVMDVTEEG